MAANFNQVRPGDLITADFMNELIDAINTLEGQIKNLEDQCLQNGGVAITDVSGTLRVGGELVVSGRNFEIPARFNTVLIGGVQVTSFNPGSSESRLVFNVPAIDGVPRKVKVVVSNSHGTATSEEFTVMPSEAVTPQGELVISENFGDLGEIQEGKTYTYNFTLDSQTNIPETYTLKTTFSNPVGGTVQDWETNSTIVNSDGKAIKSILVDPASPATVGVQVTIPAGASSVNMTIQASSVNNPDEPKMNRTSSVVTIEVGAQQEASDPRISFDTWEVALDGKIVSDPVLGDVIEVDPSGDGALIRTTAHFQVAGNYNYTAHVIPEASGTWSAEILAPADATSTEDSGSEQDIAVKLQMTVNSDTETSRHLEIRASRTDSDETGTFDSWTRMPIRKMQSA